MPNAAMSINPLIYNDFLQQMKPRPAITVSEWADKYRYLSSESSSQPGKWKTETTPYLKEIMDVANDPDVHTIVVMTCSQIGKSEAINNIIFWYLHQEPCPILMIQPTLTEAEDYSKSRISPAIRDSPVLTEIFGKESFSQKNSKNTILSKYCKGGRLSMVGSNSPAGVSSKPIKVVAGDEISRYVATKEGNSLELAGARQRTFFDKLKILTSTPSDKGICEISKYFDLSDKRKYMVPCECKEYQPLEFQHVVWEKGKSGLPLPQTAKYCCPHCGRLLTDTEINAMVKKGEWEATEPFNGIAGFGYFPEIYSPWVKMSETVQAFLDAQKNTEDLKVCVNTRFGEAWELKNESLETNAIWERREKFTSELPLDVGVVTATVDVQDNRLEVLTQAWGRDEECWNLEKIVLWGDPRVITADIINPDQQSLFEDKSSPIQKGVWQKLDKFLTRTYQHASGIHLNIAITAIDTGYLADEVYSFVKPRQKRGVCAIKGSSKSHKPIITRPTKNNKGKVLLYEIGVDSAKESLAARLRITEVGPGYMHFSNDVDKGFDYEFFEQVTSEKKEISIKNNIKSHKWIKIRARNEGWDLCVYGLAALRIICPDRKTLNEMCDYMLAQMKERAENIPNEIKKRIQKKKKRRVMSKGVSV